MIRKKGCSSIRYSEGEYEVKFVGGEEAEGLQPFMEEKKRLEERKAKENKKR